MAMDAKERKKRTIQIVAAIVVVALLAILGIFLFGGKTEEAAPAVLGPSDSMVPADPQTVGSQRGVAQLIANPGSIDLVPGSTATTFSILASGSPIVIGTVALQDPNATGIVVKPIDCPPSSQPLPAGAACTFTVEWDGATAVSTVIEIRGQTFTDTTSPAQNVSVAIPVSTNGAGVVSTAGIPTQGGFTGSPPVGQPVVGQVGSGYAEAPAAPTVGTVDAGVASAPQVSPRQQQRNQYLAARSQGALAPLSGGQLAPAARSAYASWDEIGASGTTSSYPTDMSRVITPDKAITAVIAVPIDTRNPVVAVAMVDRDVYGNNGRTVVIPRGSKLVGTPGVSDRRVGIAWKQLIMPNGVRFMLDAASGDSMGRGGVPGQVNERFLERYGFSLLPTTVSAGLTAALGGNQTSTTGVGGATQTQDARSVAAQILSGPLNKIAQDIFQKKSNIPVQIVVPAGTRITVWSLGDLRLKPLGGQMAPRAPQGQARTAASNSSTAPRIGTPSQNGSAMTRQMGSEDAEEDVDAGAVGTIDANGNYVAPQARAPRP